MKKTAVLFFFLASILATLLYGEIPVDETLRGVSNRLLFQSTEWNPLLDERLPRLIVLIATGASLAVSGFVMQSLFQNPLASPSVLGISCGGSLLVVFAFVFGWHVKYPFSIPLAAFFGSFFTLLIVYALARVQGQVSMGGLILTGIAISTLLMAIQGLLMYALKEHWQLIQLLSEWQAGTTLDRNWGHVHMQLPLTVIGLFGCFMYSKEIQILALGEEEALNLGVEVKRVRFRLFLCIAALTAGALAAVGSIAFFGLVLPHVVRSMYGHSGAPLIAICALLGSASFLFIDLLLRFLALHYLTIGNLSAVIGGVFFVYLLLKQSKTPRLAC